MATTETEIKELIHRFISKLVNGQNYDLAEELWTDDYGRHEPDTSADERGPEPFVESLQPKYEAFPDSEVQVGEIIAEDNIVAFEGKTTGTHEGAFLGVEPPYTTIEVPGNAMHRIRDGQIAKTWAT